MGLRQDRFHGALERVPNSVMISQLLPRPERPRPALPLLLPPKGRVRLLAKLRERVLHD